MKVLIITYYWPPAGGSGVQRWLKFVKYLQDFGIEPVVYTVKNPHYPTQDRTLLEEVPKDITILKQPIFEPNVVMNFFKKKKNKQQVASLSKKPSFLKGVLQYVRGNYFIPDARKFWIKPSVKYLKKYLSTHPVDLVITTGPPHSMHLIGMALKKELSVKWLADFRDPMASLFYNDDLMLSDKTQKKLIFLEKEIIKNADKVCTVSKNIQKEFQKIRKDIEVISNGFDDVDIPKTPIFPDKKFSLSHIGLLPHHSNSIILWKVLRNILDIKDTFKNDLEIRLVGNVSKNVLESIQKYKLEKYVVQIPYAVHKKAVEYQRKSQVLLLLLPKTKEAKGIVTGKIFEYLQAKRPVLAIGPTDGDLAVILKETNAGNIVDFDDEKKLKEVLCELYEAFKNNKLVSTTTNIDQFHRKELTKKLSNVIKDIVKN